MGCSNLDTGEAEYLECTDMRKPEDVNKVRASASLPLVSNIVEVDGMKLLDGGVSGNAVFASVQERPEFCRPTSSDSVRTFFSLKRNTLAVT